MLRKPTVEKAADRDLFVGSASLSGKEAPRPDPSQLDAVTAFGALASRVVTYVDFKERLYALGHGKDFELLMDLVPANERRRFFEGRLTPAQILTRYHERLPEWHRVVSSLTPSQRTELQQGKMSAARALQIAAQPDAPNVVDAVIIGAGTAGLVAAGEISAHGHSALVLEGRARSGGRTFASKTARGTTMDHCAHWIHDPTGPLARAAHARGFAHVRDDLRFWFFRESGADPAREGAKLLKARHQIEKEIGRLARHKQDHTLRDVNLAQGPYGIHAMMNFTWGTPPDRVSVRDADRMPHDFPAWRLKQGYGELVRSFSHGAAIQYDATVTKIERRGDTYIVTAGGRSYASRTVFYTGPAWLLPDIEVSPALPESKVQAAHDLPPTMFKKVTLEFDSEPFGKTPPGCHVRVDGYPQVEFVLPIEGEAQRSVTALLNGDFLDELEACGQTRAYLLSALGAAYGSIIQRAFVQDVLFDTTGETLSQGSWAFARLGRTSARDRLRKPLKNASGEDAFFFGGEATSPSHAATVDGAYWEGKNWGRAISKALGLSG